MELSQLFLVLRLNSLTPRPWSPDLRKTLTTAHDKQSVNCVTTYRKQSRPDRPESEHTTSDTEGVLAYENIKIRENVHYKRGSLSRLSLATYDFFLPLPFQFARPQDNPDNRRLNTTANGWEGNCRKRPPPAAAAVYYWTQQHCSWSVHSAYITQLDILLTIRQHSPNPFNGRFSGWTEINCLHNFPLLFMHKILSGICSLTPVEWDVKP